MPNNIRAIKFLNWYFLRIGLDDLYFTKPLEWVGGGQGGGAVQIAVNGRTTAGGYSVPNPTAEEMTAIYNAVVAGNNVQIVDSNNVYYQVILADSMDGAINIEILYFSEMALIYSLEHDVVTIESKKIGGGGLPDQTENAGKFLTTDGTNASWSGYCKKNDGQSYGTVVFDPAGKTTTDITTNAIVAIAPNGNTSALSANILGTASSTASIAVGFASQATNSYAVALGAQSRASGGQSVAVGNSAKAEGYGSVAVGYLATSKVEHAIQLGSGTNAEANTFSVGLSNTNNYKLLNTDGTIPAERLATPPTADGNYVLKATVSGGVVTMQWVAE